MVVLPVTLSGLLAVEEIELRPLEQKPIEKPMFK